jgi:phage gp45-like
MTESDIIKLINAQVKKQLNVILSGQSGNAADDGHGNYSEDIQNMFTGMDGITSRPVSHPYGFASKAPDGTTQVTAKQGDHTGNRLVIGHRAADRPSDLGDGETCVYSSSGYRIVWKQGSIMIGKGTQLEPLILGQTLNTFLTSLLTDIIAHTHASPGAPPTNIADFQQLLTNTLNANKILVEDGGGE